MDIPQTAEHQQLAWIIPNGYIAGVTLPEKIKAERLKLGLNKTEFAARVGVPQPYVSKWEGGRQGVDLVSATLLSKATGQPADYFASATRRGRVLRASIDAVAKSLDDVEYQILFDQAKDLAEKHAKALRRTDSPGSGQAAKGRRRRARRRGSAPAA